MLSGPWHRFWDAVYLRGYLCRDVERRLSDYFLLAERTLPRARSPRRNRRARSILTGAGTLPGARPAGVSLRDACQREPCAEH